MGVGTSPGLLSAWLCTALDPFLIHTLQEQAPFMCQQSTLSLSMLTGCSFFFFLLCLRVQYQLVLSAQSTVRMINRKCILNTFLFLHWKEKMDMGSCKTAFMDPLYPTGFLRTLEWWRPFKGVSFIMFYMNRNVIHPSLSSAWLVSPHTTQTGNIPSLQCLKVTLSSLPVAHTWLCIVKFCPPCYFICNKTVQLLRCVTLDSNEPLMEQLCSMK